MNNMMMMNIQGGANNHEPVMIFHVSHEKCYPGSVFKINEIDLPFPPLPYRKKLSIVIDTTDYKRRFAASCRKRNRKWRVTVRDPITWLEGISKVAESAK